MWQTRAIADRLCAFISQYAKSKHVTEEQAAQRYFGMSAYRFHDIQSGRIVPSLQTCEIAIKKGCHPRYLYLGDMDIPGDPVRCFACGRGNCCRILSVPQCMGYNNCSFYKPEQIYLALAGGARS